MPSRLEDRLLQQRKNRKKHIWIIASILATILAAIAVGFGLSDSGSNSSVINQSKQVMGSTSVSKKINILVLGIDQRRNDIGRSNVTCVVTVDTGTKNVSMLWIPRDSRVKIPGNGWNKIGHAYAYDGHKLSEQTVADLLGVPIDYYVAVNMSGFKKAIDALGGVDINVDKRMYYYDPYDEGEVNNNGLIDLKPGLQHMDGETALEYVRFRHDEMGDIGRIERQQKFVKALLAQMSHPAVITKMPGIITEVNSAIQTDLPISQMLSLGKIINDAYKQGLKTDMVPGKPVYIDGISYWLPDISEMRKQVSQTQGITIDDKYNAITRNMASEYANSLAKSKVIPAP